MCSRTVMWPISASTSPSRWGEGEGAELRCSFKEQFLAPIRDALRLLATLREARKERFVLSLRVKRGNLIESW